MKKIMKILLVIIFVMSLFPSQVQAKEDQALLRISSIKIDSLSDKHGEKLNVLFQIDTKGSNVNFERLVLTWDANGIEQSMVFGTLSHEVTEITENKYKAESYFPTGKNYETGNNEFEKGKYTLKSITVYDDVNKAFTYLRDDSLWKGVVNGGDFTLDKDNAVNKTAVIKNMTTSKNFNSLTMPFKETVSIDIECQEGVIPELTFVFYSENAAKEKVTHYLQFELETVKTGSGIYDFVLDSKTLLKYGISDFKIAAILSGSRHFTTGIECTNKILYSNLESEILDEIYFFDDPNIERSKLVDIDKLNIHLTNEIKKDEKAPILKNIAFKDHVVTEPGVAYLNIDVEEENEIEYISIRFIFDNGHILNASGNRLDDLTHFPVWFQSKKEEGTARLLDILISDYAGNTSTYVAKGLEDKTDFLPGFYEVIDLNCSIEVKPYQEFEAIYNLNDTDILTLIQGMQVDRTYVMDTSETKYVDKKIFDYIKGKNIILIFEDLLDFQKPQWIINGKDIVNETKDINLATRNQYINTKIDISYGDALIVYGTDKDIAGKTREERNQYILDVVNSYEGARYYQDYLKKYDKEKDDLLEIFIKEYEKYTVLRFIFSNNGLLPGKMVIRAMDTDNYFADNELHLYYIDNEGNYSLIQKNIKKTKDGFYNMTITHNSAYLLSVKELTEEEKEDIEEVEKPDPEEGEVVKPKPGDEPIINPDTSDHTSVEPLLWMGITSIGLIYLTKKRRKVVK